MTGNELIRGLANAHIVDDARELREAAQSGDVVTVEEAAEQYLAAREYQDEVTRQQTDAALRGNATRTV